MSIISLAEALAFLDIGTGYFEITAENDILNMTYNSVTEDVEIADGTYQGDDLASELQTKIDAAFTSITPTVTYDEDTYKFRIAVTANTIIINTASSDAALTFGFTEDPIAALFIVSDTAATEDPTDIVNTINNGVDSFVKGYCDRNFESANYKEYHNGNDKQNLFLKEYPIISIFRLSIGRNDGIKVNNSATYTYATVSVTSTGVILNKDGTETTLLFADYAMLTDMVTQINLETNWQASVVNSNYASYKSTELIEVMGLQCLNASWAYLEIPDEPESDFEVYADEGYIYKHSGFARGMRNIRIDYKAGYSSGDMPSRLKMACLILVKFLFQKREEEVFGRKQYGLGNVRATLEAEMPGEVRLILDKFARKDV